MIKKLLFIFLFVCVLAAFVNSCGREEKTYKIGAVFSITGPASPLGVPEKNTAEMLVEQINAAGGINKHKVKLFVYDTAGEEATARTRVDKLINVDKVAAIIGPSRSGPSLAIIEAVTNAKVPNISCAASVKIVEPVAERKWVFKTPQSDALIAQVIADYLKAQNISKAAIITTNDPFGASGKEQLEIILPKEGIEIVDKEEFGEKDQDALVQLTKIKGTDAQAIVCWSVQGGGATVTKNMKKDLKMEIPLIMSHGVANRAYIELAGDAANGVVFPAGKILVANDLPDNDPQKPVLLKYIEDYKAKYNGEIPNTFAGHAWDAMYLVFNAMKKVGDNKAKIRDEIENTKNFVGTGGIFNFSPNDHNGLTRDGVVMIKIVDGNWTLLK